MPTGSCIQNPKLPLQQIQGSVCARSLNPIPVAQIGHQTDSRRLDTLADQPQVCKLALSGSPFFSGCTPCPRWPLFSSDLAPSDLDPQLSYLYLTVGAQEIERPGCACFPEQLSTPCAPGPPYQHHLMAPPLLFVAEP